MGNVPPWCYYTSVGTPQQWVAAWQSKQDDIGLSPAQIVALKSGILAGSFIVSALPSISDVPIGARAFVTDATATTFLSIVAGGGANAVPVVSNGTNWVIG